MADYAALARRKRLDALDTLVEAVEDHGDEPRRARGDAKQAQTFYAAMRAQHRKAANLAFFTVRSA